MLATCDFAGDWTGSFARAKWPANKDTYTIVATSDTTWNVTTKDQSWSPGSGTFTARDDGTYYATAKLIGNVKKGVVSLGGVMTKDCLKIYWDNDSVWCKGLKPGDKDCGKPPPGGYPDPDGVSKVYLVFSNHLDVGYTGACL